MITRVFCLCLLLVLLPQRSQTTTVYKCGTNSEIVIDEFNAEATIHENKEVINSVIAVLGSCTTSRCSLKRNSTMHIEIQFKPDFDVKNLITEVYGVALNIPIPLLGVDNKSVCNNIFDENGTKKHCPLPKGGTYIYKDDIYIIEAYPKFKVDVHWSLKDPISRKIVTCFEAPAKIID